MVVAAYSLMFAVARSDTSGMVAQAIRAWIQLLDDGVLSLVRCDPAQTCWRYHFAALGSIAAAYLMSRRHVSAWADRLGQHFKNTCLIASPSPIELATSI